MMPRALLFIDKSTVLFGSSAFRDEVTYLQEEETAQTVQTITEVVEGSQSDSLFLVRQMVDTRHCDEMLALHVNLAFSDVQ